ncbi:MAG TPA: cupin domain-containing protein, partial [Candidatus Eisenbacteria bacterium]
RDEVYVVISGSGKFLNGVARRPFGPGDFLFVPAGVEHRFEEFSDDLAVWVIFYGPEGGEAGLGV